MAGVIPRVDKHGAAGANDLGYGPDVSTPRVPTLDVYAWPKVGWKYLSGQTVPAELPASAQQVSKYWSSFPQIPKYNRGVSSFKAAFSIPFPS